MSTKTTNENLVNNSNHPQQEQVKSINKLKNEKMKTTNGNIMETTEIKINQVEQFINYLDETLSKLYEERKSLEGELDDENHTLNHSMVLEDDDIERIEMNIDHIETELEGIDNMIGEIEGLIEKIHSTTDEFNNYEWEL